MTPIELVRQHLEDLIQLRRPGGIWESTPDLRFCCIEDLVMQYGAVFKPSQERPPIRPIAKLCFFQAYRMATRKNSKWIYCEGYAVDRIGLVVHHAWITTASEPGKAYELAWGDDGDERAYIGIPFQAEFVRKTHHASKRQWYSVLDTWWQNYPLLTGKTKIEDVRHPCALVPTIT